MPIKILHIVGTGSSILRIAPIMRSLAHSADGEQTLVHTGPHYDGSFLDQPLAALDLPAPDLDLGIGPGPDGRQTGRTMIALEPIIQRMNPDWVVTVGDVNSTLAAALVAAKLGVRVAHVEAGHRSHDRTASGEVNRILTDRMGDALFASERAACDNLRAEGIDPGRIHFVGNVMIDTLDRYRSRVAALAVHDSLDLREREYLVATLHRPENIDDPRRLDSLLVALAEAGFECGAPVLLPLHPRTARNIRRFGLDSRLRALVPLAPLGYLEFLSLMDHAGAVLTDSSGVQEETTVLGVPCLTLRPVTDRPVTVERGTNQLVDDALECLAAQVASALDAERRPFRPPLWDGRAADRIAAVLVRESGDDGRVGTGRERTAAARS
ncbi:MAG: non-hydrolyzing UDP-N-acetylglucosamine 2-epimerase [Gemmatimonadota bacterium]